MATSFAASALPFWFNQKMKGEGTRILVQSGTIVANDYGEKNPDDFTLAGSYFSRAIFSPITEQERQLLPEGNRDDEIFNIMVQTGSTMALDFRIQISGTSIDFNVVQLLDTKIMGDTVLYKKVRGVKLR